MEVQLDSNMGIAEVVGPGGPSLVIQEEGMIREIDVEALASWSELLGVDDMSEVLEAIIYVQDHGEPEPCPETGDNVWTDSFTLLQAREQAREGEAVIALEEGLGEDPRSPLLRSTLAAYNAVHQPIDGGECVMDRCRRAARERLGITREPSRKTGAVSRMTTHKAPVGGAPDDIRQVLAEIQGDVESCRREFLHSLAGSSENPLRDTASSQAEHTPEEVDPFAATMRKYGGGA